MLRFWNNFLLTQNLFALCAILFISCGFIDLRPIGISIDFFNETAEISNDLKLFSSPSGAPASNEKDYFLPDMYTPVILNFDTAMFKNETEASLQINSDLGAVRGDKFWKSNSLYFVPVSGWTAGIRYTLSFSGTIRSADGREMRVEHFISFYAINKNNPPLLEKHSPSNGDSIGTNDVIMEFYFSDSMERFSVESALTLDGFGNKNFEWLGDDKILKVIIEKPLSPYLFYRWSLKDSAKSKNGIPLVKTYNGYFTTDLDKTFPQVTNVYPVLFSDGSWYPTGSEIETGLQQGQGIAVSFNKTMGENVIRSLRFEPSLTGRTELLSNNSIVYIFTRAPDSEISYTLIVSGDTRDSEGIKIGTDYRITFVPDIPFLNVCSVLFNENIIVDNFDITNAIPVSVDQATGNLSLSIHFSLPFNNDEKKNVPLKITINPFFPKTLPPIAVEYVNWISNDRLYMRWEGLSPGESGTEISNYYVVTIPGGKNGINCESGIFMKEDITFYLEAVK
ncbi:MAG: hypothetical protein FWB86_00720 [Treponema sp.]|nr:hypothetical protein [Treponema sp.]MCL2250618.1 hypothetical protein [Treponema sp.]